MRFSVALAMSPAVPRRASAGVRSDGMLSTPWPRGPLHAMPRVVQQAAWLSHQACNSPRRTTCHIAYNQWRAADATV